MRRFVTLSIILLFGSIGTSILLTHFSNRGKASGLPVQEENLILNRFGIETTKFRLYSYPAKSSIGWSKKEKFAGDVSLRISIEDVNVKSKYYSGIKFLTPLSLSLQRDKGILVFWVKGGKDYSRLSSIELGLKDKIGVQVTASPFPLIDLSEKWQQMELPLSKFSNEGLLWDKGNARHGSLNWDEISDIAFVVLPEADCGPFEIFIDDLKIMDKDKAIYDLFSAIE